MSGSDNSSPQNQPVSERGSTPPLSVAPSLGESDYSLLSSSESDNEVNSDDENTTRNHRVYLFSEYLQEGVHLDDVIYDIEPEKAIQQIIGVNEEDNSKFLIKWSGLSHIHNSYLDKDDIILYPGGESAMRKFHRKNIGLVSSTSAPNLLIKNADSYNTAWTTVDRVIAVKDKRVLIKWSGLPYDQCTWEDASESMIDHIKAFEKRSQIRVPRTFSEASHQKVDKSDQTYPYSEEEPDLLTLQDKSGRTLRPYQVDGVRWLIDCFHNNQNSMLADEMGLGKTAQVSAALRSLMLTRSLNGPVLIVTPLSTLAHWRAELERWANLNILVFHGSPLAKEILQRYEMLVEGDNKYIKFHAIVISYETLLADLPVFTSVDWGYLVADEAHRIRNRQGLSHQSLKKLNAKHITLLTGTPIQNSTEELIALLKFLIPSIEFDDIPEGKDKIEKLMVILEPLMLRRLKNDVDGSIAPLAETIVEVPLTGTQKVFYKAVLDDHAAILLGRLTGGAKASLTNLMMQLRKICNHPYLIPGATAEIENRAREELGESATIQEVQRKGLLQSSGKLALLSKLLPRLRENHHKVLIFSQMVSVLDILAEYLDLEGFPFERLDGRVAAQARQAAIDRFTSDSEGFIFLISTRAGGVGINLTAADTVIIYDSDWNPQNDIQAQARCHRIGQTREVRVYRLVAKGTYEIEMLDRASKKLGLDRVLLGGVSDIEKVLRRGVYDMANEEGEEVEAFTEADIESLLSGNKGKGRGSEATKAEYLGDSDEPAAAFWARVLTIPQEDEAMQTRRVRSTSKLQLDSDEDDDEEEGIQKRMIRRGCDGSAGQKSALRAALNCVVVSDKDLPIVEEIMGANYTHSQPSGKADPSQKKMVKRCILMRKVAKALAALQPEDADWPAGGDPLLGYAMLYGAKKNGFGQSLSVFAGTGFEPSEPLTEKGIVKAVENLVEILPLAIPDGKLLEPAEWKDSHVSLFSRTDLSEAELGELFKTLVYLGTDVDPLPYCRFPCVTEETIKIACAQLTKLAEESLPDPEENALLARLGQFSSRVWISRLRSNTRELKRIRLFTNNLNDDQLAALTTIRPPDGSPTWWNSDHDLYLMKKVSQYGLLFVSTWIVDATGPIREYINPTLIPEFEKCAQLEEARLHSERPKDAGDLTFLLNDRVRLTRCTLIIKFIETRLKRTTTKEENVSELTELPLLPLEVGPQLIIRAFGQFHATKDSFPAGFISERYYSSIDEPDGKEWYESSTQLKDGKLEFKVRQMGGSKHQFTSHTSSSVWEKVIKKVQTEKAKRGKSKRKFTTVSGPFMYGTSNPQIQMSFKLLRESMVREDEEEDAQQQQ